MAESTPSAIPCGSGWPFPPDTVVETYTEDSEYTETISITSHI